MDDQQKLGQDLGSPPAAVEPVPLPKATDVGLTQQPAASSQQPAGGPIQSPQVEPHPLFEKPVTVAPGVREEGRRKREEGHKLPKGVVAGIAALVFLVVGGIGMGLYLLNVKVRQPTSPVEVSAGENEEQEQEPNDTIATATVSRDLGQKHRGKISSRDTDFWKVVLSAGRTYQLQMVKDDNDGQFDGSKQGTGDDEKDQIVWGLADSSGTMVVSDKKKNFTYSVPDGSDGIYYVKVSSLISKELGYKFVLKDISGKETPTPTPPTVSANCTSLVGQVGNGAGGWLTKTDADFVAMVRPGDRVRFMCTGVKSSGTFTKAAFFIKDILHVDDVVKLNDTQFAVEYTISAAGALKVESVLLHDSKGWVD